MNIYYIAPNGSIIQKRLIACDTIMRSHFKFILHLSRYCFVFYKLDLAFQKEVVYSNGSSSNENDGLSRENDGLSRIKPTLESSGILHYTLIVTQRTL